MKLYEEALFGAFVWGQAIENHVQFLVGQYAEDGRLQLIDKKRRRFDNDRVSFNELIDLLKPRINDELHESLHELRRMRNCVVHKSRYMERIFLPPEDRDKDLLGEIERFREVKRLAGELFGKLLDLP